MRIRILPEAERDLDLGADFYEAQSPGAGASFIRGLLDDIDGLLKRGGVFLGAIMLEQQPKQTTCPNTRCVSEWTPAPGEMEGAVTVTDARSPRAREERFESHYRNLGSRVNPAAIGSRLRVEKSGPNLCAFTPTTRMAPPQRNFHGS